MGEKTVVPHFSRLTFQNIRKTNGFDHEQKVKLWYIQSQLNPFRHSNSLVKRERKWFISSNVDLVITFIEIQKIPVHCIHNKLLKLFNICVVIGLGSGVIDFDFFWNSNHRPNSFGNYSLANLYMCKLSSYLSNFLSFGISLSHCLTLYHFLSFQSFARVVINTNIKQSNKSTLFPILRSLSRLKF